MNHKEFASMLNGREMGDEISEEESELALKDNLVVVYGYSDDCMEFEGAIYDELSCDGGTEVKVNKNGLVHNEYGNEDCPYFEQMLNDKKYATIKANWCEGDYAWSYETEIPHSTFDIMEDEYKYCRGIVFCLDDVTC